MTGPFEAEQTGRYHIRLEVFEGPLDLLLHLVRKHELDIFDIPIAFVTERYLEYLDLMKSLNLDVAGEFLYYAALLAHIKSKQMLPPDEEPADEEEGIDPALELQQRLLEYKRFKEAAEGLSDRPQVGRRVWLRGVEHPSGEQEQTGEPELPPLAEVGLFKLVDAMAKVLSRAKPEAVHDVLVDRTSLADRINQLVDRLQETSKLQFTRLLEEIEPGPGFRIRVVVTFLALLEMTRQRIVRIYQPAREESDSAEPDIYIERVVHAIVLPSEVGTLADGPQDQASKVADVENAKQTH